MTGDARVRATMEDDTMGNVRRSTLGRIGRMALVLSAVAVTVVPFVSVAPTSGATPTVVVSGFSAARTDDDWGITESCLDTTRGYLADTANFGPSGVVEATMDVTTTGVDTATSADLAGVNVFFTGWVTTTSYTNAEKTALLNYVKAGGALIGTTDGTDHDMSSIFGMTLADSPGGEETGTITDATSPLADGPFGTVTTFEQYGDIGHYTDVGPGHTVGTNPEGPAIVVIPPGALSATSGPVVMVSDVDVFSDCAEASPVGSVANETLIKNIFAYVATAKAVPPTTTTASTTTTTEAPTTTVAPVEAQPAFTG
ncbi:MAG TPA: hypothetical protein VMT43_10900 [Acidimicrobiales bacterium]|nr:hypothetical protein [Acidimicrobiales bacterium]